MIASLTGGDSTSVFISYARSTNRDAAVALAAALQGSGASAFLDTEEIAVGERVLAAQERLLGPNNRATLRAVHNLAATLAETLRAGGSLGLARNLEERVLDERIRRLGPGHPETLHALEQLAATRRAQGDEAEAMLIEQMVASQPAANRVRLAELG